MVVELTHPEAVLWYSPQQAAAKVPLSRLVEHSDMLRQDVTAGNLLLTQLDCHAIAAHLMVNYLEKSPPRTHGPTQDAGMPRAAARLIKSALRHRSERVPPLTFPQHPSEHVAKPIATPMSYSRRVYGYAMTGFASTAGAAAASAVAVGTGALCIGPVAAATGAVVAPAALLLLASELPPRWNALRHGCCLAATLSLGVGLGVMVAASPGGALATMAVTAILIGAFYCVSHHVKPSLVARWNGGPALALRLALNAGGAVATCLTPGSAIMATLVAAAGLGGAAPSLLFAQAGVARQPSTSQNDALCAAIEMYVHTVSTLAFTWRVLSGARFFLVRRS